MSTDLPPVPRQWPSIYTEYAFERTGSSLTSAKPNDLDHFIQWSRGVEDAVVSAGYTKTEHANAEKDYPNDSVHSTWRKDEYNIIFVKTKQDWMRWLIASQLLAELNLTEKRQRVTLFQFITEGKIRGCKFPTTAELAATIVKE